MATLTEKRMGQGTRALITRLDRRVWVFALAAAGAIVASVLVQDDLQRLTLAMMGLTLIVVTCGVRLMGWVGQRQLARDVRAVMRFVEHDAAPSFMADDQGGVTYQNSAALERFGGCQGKTVNRSVAGLFANPDAVVMRLRAAAEATGAAREDVITRVGHIRVAVHRVQSGYLWRLEDLVDRPNRTGDGVSIPMLTASRSGTILFMNEPLRQAVGARLKKLDDLFDDLPLTSGAVHAMRLNGEVHFVRVFVVDGSAGRSEIYVLPNEAGAEPAEQDAISAVMEGLPVALLQLDRTGRVLTANRSAKALMPDVQDGHSSLASLVDGLGRSVSEWVKEASKGRGLNRPEVVRLSGGGAETFLQISLGRIIGDGQTSLIAVMNDATELKTLEAQFVQSQKMQAIGQLAGGVAHDFNNLLTAISGHCDLLLLRHDKGDSEYADLVQINQNANRAAALVGQLLAFSRKQTLQMEQIDLRDILGDLTHLLNRLVGERVQLTLTHDPGLMPIKADRRQLEQVIMNLVVNARDAMPEGGEVRIETSCEYLSSDMKRDTVVVPAGQYVVVTVADDGTGIPADKLRKIFEPFFTTKRTGEGTGLGLSMVYGIIKQTGGFVFADSVVGQGAAFRLYFPADDGELLTAEPATITPTAEPLLLEERFAQDIVEKVARAVPDPVRKPDAQDARPANAPDDAAESTTSAVVLLVEDEAPVRAFASRALKLRGYQVLEAANAEEALELLEDKALHIDLFVTDVMMPGLDGPTWVRMALQERPNVKTVFVSGYAQGAFEDDNVPVPNSVFLPKPFSLSELTSTVQAQLH